MCWELKVAITWVCMCPDEPVMKVPHRQTLEAGEIVRCTVSARCGKPLKAPSDELVKSWKRMNCPLHRSRYPFEIVKTDDGGMPDLL